MADNVEKKITSFITKKRPFLIPVLLIASVVIVGVLGYHFIEGWSFFDSLYMTIITVATVGFGETHPLSTVGKAFTIFIILSGVSLIGYSLSMIVAFIIEGDLIKIISRRKTMKEIAKLSDHIIVCGMGNTGRHVVEEFLKIHTTFVVIDKDPCVEEKIKGYDFAYFIHGDAVQDAVLISANIEKAKGLIATLSDDKENLFVVLTARELNPRIKIVSKLVDKESEKKLITAGADHVVSPDLIGGMRIASQMIRPAVVSFLDKMLRGQKEELRLEEVDISRNSPFFGKTLMECHIPQKTGLIVVALKRGEMGEYVYNPQSNTNLDEEDVLIVLGSVTQVDKLRDLVKG